MLTFDWTKNGGQVKDSKGDEQALYIIVGAGGMRISEALALETQHFINDCRTITIRQQVDGDTPRIVQYLKTDAACREVDVSEEVAVCLRAFLAGKEGLLLKTRNGTPHLHNSLKKRWLTPRLKAMGLYERGLGWHGFRRFRKTLVAWEASSRGHQQLLDGSQAKNDVRTLLTAGRRT